MQRTEYCLRSARLNDTQLIALMLVSWQVGRHALPHMQNQTSVSGLERAVGYIAIGSRGQETQNLHLASLLCRSMRHTSTDAQACCYLSQTNRYQASCSEAFLISRLSKLPIGVLAASKSRLRCHTRGYCGYMACEYNRG